MRLGIEDLDLILKERKDSDGMDMWNTPMVQSRQPLTYRLMESLGLGGPRCLFVCVEVLQPSQPNGVLSRAVSLPNHTFTGQA